MSARRESLTLQENHHEKEVIETSGFGDHVRGRQMSVEPQDVTMVQGDQRKLARNLKGRHMQMIAIGGAIGAGLFIGSGGAFQNGGPGSVLLGFLIVGIMIYLMMQALAELTVMYPINGAFTMYIVRFIDPSWGFACGWEYAFSWLLVLPFEISAAVNIIHYWPGSENTNAAAYIVPLLVCLVVIQYFGVRGYGEVEFVLSMLKIIACVGFMILAIIIDCGGVPTDNRGYIGARYWHEGPGAFLNGFHGFCAVFVTASFAYSGTELTGLAAAEAEDPRKEIPRATKQVVYRILLFYVVNLFLVGLIVPSDTVLYQSEGGSSRHSPFVIAIQLAGIKALPSIFNAVILISVMSVANSCTFGSTRTLQALAANGMAPKAMAYVDRKGRPLVVTIIQLVLGCLAFINLAPTGGDIFGWLLAFSGITPFFVFGSIALAHIRFRNAWKLNGHSVDEIPYKAKFGIIGSWICVVMNFLCLVANFYISLYPVGGPYLNAKAFFQNYLAAPFIIFLYVIWKGYSWAKFPSHRAMYVPLKDLDIYTGMREGQAEMISGNGVTDEMRHQSIAEIKAENKKGAKGWGMSVVRSLF